MRYGTAHSPFGRLLLAESDAGLCWLSFVNKWEQAADILQEAFAGSTGFQDDHWSQSIMDQWFDELFTPRLAPIGTPFQIKVWNELLKTTHGSSCSYSELAARIGRPSAVRAVATAVARNPVALFIPCHRVLPKDGSVGNYRWGADKKRAILEWEHAHTTQATGRDGAPNRPASGGTQQDK